jgi:hypothetical protein
VAFKKPGFAPYPRRATVGPMTEAYSGQCAHIADSLSRTCALYHPFRCWKARFRPACTPQEPSTALSRQYPILMRQLSTLMCATPIGRGRRRMQWYVSSFTVDATGLLSLPPAPLLAPRLSVSALNGSHWIGIPKQTMPAHS